MDIVSRDDTARFYSRHSSKCESMEVIRSRRWHVYDRHEDFLLISRHDTDKYAHIMPAHLPVNGMHHDVIHYYIFI